MTKIVLITPILQHYRLTFYEKLSKAVDDYDLTVFHGVKKKEDGRPGFEGEPRFAQAGFPEYKYKIYPFELVYNWGMYTAVRRINPDIVILQGITGDITNRRIIFWARRRKKKIIVWACAWEPGRAKGALLRFKNKLVAAFFRKSDYFLTYSNFASEYVESMGIDASLIETCYNGIETDTMESNSEETLKRAEKLIKELKLEKFITFLYVGGLIAEKRTDLLIDAFSQLRMKYDNIRLLIIGDGPERSSVKNQLERYGDENISYLGRIVEGVDPYFAISDCFVLPGIGGLALNQAMYWGKPCIVSKADGTEDDLVIEGKTGYRFLEGKLDSLVSAMEKRILEDPETLLSMSDAAREIINKKSNVNNMVRIFSETIMQLIENERRKV